MTIIQERLDALAEIELDQGSHNNFEQGHCAMEVVSWLAGLGFTDAPSCASPVLRRYTITLNDRWDHERRQTLKPYLVRMIGTGSDGKDGLREQIAARFLLERLIEPWLRLAGMEAEAEEVAATLDQPLADQCAALRRWSDAAWKVRQEKRRHLREIVEAKVRERLAEKPAAAAADAAAAAAAVAVADAVAAAAAVADAAAAAVAAAESGVSTWSAAHAAARNYYREHPLPVSQQVADLAATQRGLALELLEAMIDPAVQA